MTEYNYPNKVVLLDIEQLHIDVAASAMADKAIIGATWIEAKSLLVIYFQNELSPADKILLDAIVSNLPSGE